MIAPLMVLVAIGTLAFGALLVCVAADVRAARVRAVVAATTSMTLIVAASAWAFASRAPCALEPVLVVDELSAVFLPFVSALVLAVALGSPVGSSLASTLARGQATGAIFLAFLVVRSPILLWTLWLLSAFPTFLELGGRNAMGGSARVFAVHRIADAALVGAGLLLASFGGSFVSWAGPLLILGVFVREGVFPVHAWVPALYERAPLGAAALFTQSQIGAFLLLRLVLAGPLAPPGHLLDSLGMVTAVYGALLAVAQPSVRRSLGYLCVSQSALVLTGLSSGTAEGLTGGVLLVLAVGLAQTGFSLALAALEARRGRLSLARYAGGLQRMPLLAGVLLILGLASVGLPGSLGFVAEDLVFHAALEYRPYVGLAMVFATAINGITVLRMFFVLFGGRPCATKSPDLVPRERWILFSLVVTLIGLGLAPPSSLSPSDGWRPAVSVGTEDPFPPSRSEGQR